MRTRARDSSRFGRCVVMGGRAVAACVLAAAGLLGMLESITAGRHRAEGHQPGEPQSGPVRLHEIDQILLLSSWFRCFPEELGRTWVPG